MEAAEYLAVGLALDRAGRFAAADEALTQAIDAARGDGATASSIRARALVARAGIRRYDGRSVEAADDVEAALVALASASQPGPLDMGCRCIRVEALAERARIVAELGEPDVARSVADQAVAEGAALGPGSEEDRARFAAGVARGSVRRTTGDLPGAQADLDAALALAERLDDPDGLLVVEVLDELGILGKATGAYDRSEEAYRRALAILGATVGDGHPDEAAIHHNLGGLLHARGDPAAAEPHARRSVELHAATLGEDHLATLLDRSAWGAILDRLGRSEEAEVQLRDALARLEAKVGLDHREVAVVLNNLAAIAQRRGAYDEAEDYCRRAVEIKERTSGGDAPSLATSLNNLGSIRRARGDHAGAIEAYDRAIAILERAVPDDHPTLAIVRRNRARVRPDDSAARVG